MLKPIFNAVAVNGKAILFAAGIATIAVSSAFLSGGCSNLDEVLKNLNQEDSTATPGDSTITPPDTTGNPGDSTITPPDPCVVDPNGPGCQTAPTTYTLTVGRNDASAGGVSREPGKSTYDAGETVTVTATPKTGYLFTGWSGAVSGTTNPVTIIMNGDKTLTANFVWQDTTPPPPPVTMYELIVDVSPAGDGSVSLDPDNQDYEEGAAVTATATAYAGYRFTGWSDAANGTTNPVTIIMDGNKTLTAHFEQLPKYTITFNANGGNALNPGTATTGTDGKLASLPTPTRTNHSFKGWWTAAAGGDSVALSKVYSANTTIYAHWAENAVQPVTYTLTISATSGGTVSPAAGAHSYASGTSVTVTATANSGYTFKNWSGASTSTSATATITMDGNKTLTANFELSGTQDPCANNPTPLCPNYCDVNKTAPQCQTDQCITNPMPTCSDYCTKPSLVSNISDGVEFLQGLDGSGDWGYNYYWMLLLFDEANATYTQSGDEFTINVSRVGSKDWHAKITHSVPLIKGKKYTISFDAQKGTNRTSSEIVVDFGGPVGPCDKGVVVCNGGSYIPWDEEEENGNLGWQNAVFSDNPYGLKNPVTTTWKTFSYTFKMDYPDDLQGQISISVGQSTGTFKIRNIKVKPADCR